MRNSKFLKITVFLIKAIICILVFVGTASLLGYLGTPSTSYTRIQFHDLYTTYDEDGENMDLLFLGTSHAYRAFDTAIFDEELDVNSYNFGTSMQTITSSYYILKEILKTNHPDRVVFELTYTCFREKDHQPLKSVIVSQWMKPSINKVDFILHEFAFEDLFYAIVPAYTFRENLTAPKVAANLKAKDTEEYKTYDVAAARSSSEWMENKGYVYTDRAMWILHTGRMNPETFEVEKINPKYVEYFEKIVQLCREENVELICVTAPLPKPTLLELGNYGEICEWLDDLTERNGVPYYNFNLIREQWFPVNNGHFYDSNHINGKTSKDFSRLVARMFEEEANDTFIYSDYFYSNWEEAKSHLNYITNAYMTLDEDEENYILTGHATSGVEGAQYEYSYWLYNPTDEANSKMLRDWDSDPVYTISKDYQEGYWEVMVAARFVGSDATMMNTQCEIMGFPRTIIKDDLQYFRLNRKKANDRREQDGRLR